MARERVPAPAAPAPVPAAIARRSGRLDVRTLQRAIGNRATGRVLQRYVILPAAGYQVLSGQPEFEAQTVAPPNIQAPTAAAPANLRVSDDGRMAVEDTTLAARQPKVFYAARGVITDANKALKRVHSKYELTSDRANALRVTLPGRSPRDLDRVLPRWRVRTGVASETGLTMDVDEDCIAVAREVMRHADNSRQPRTSQSLPEADFAENRVARYMATFVQTQIAQGNATGLNAFWNWFTSAHAGAKAEFADGIPMDVPTMNGIAVSYANLLATQPALATSIARTLGVNRFALPKVGEAYETHRIGPGQPAQTRAGGASGTIRDFWAQHIGGVVAASGTDRVTLENYARTHELGHLQGSAPHYYFQMYGTGAGQSWHEAWTSGAVALGLPPVGQQGADERLTVVVRPG